MSCWAAALESWLSVCLSGSPYDEDWAVRSFTRWQATDCRIEWAGLRALADLFRMRSEIVGMGALTPDYFYNRLQSGILYLTYVPTTGQVDSHSVVAYGVGFMGVDVMDPLEGYLTRPLEFFGSRTKAFVGWPSCPGGVIPDPASRVDWFLKTGMTPL